MAKSRFDMVDPTYSGEFYFQGGEKGVLLIHGFTASPAFMYPLGEALSKKGYSVLGVRLPGHAQTVEEMEKTTWRDWLNACRNGFNRLAQHCSEIFVIGHSMGGTLSLLLAEELPVTGAVSICAPIKINNPFAPLAPVIWPLYRYTRFEPSKVEPSPFEAGYTAAPVRSLGQLLRLIALSRQGLGKITCPLMVVQASKDMTVKPESAQMIYSGAENANFKKLLWLEESGHICTVRPEFDKLFGGISEFLEDACVK